MTRSNNDAPSVAKKKSGGRAKALSSSGVAQNNRQDMGQRLRAIRKAHKLTLLLLSQRSGVALSTLSKMELGQVSISYEKFVAVAKALGVDVSRLFDADAPDNQARAPTFVHSIIAESPGYLSDQYHHRMLAADYPRKYMEPLYSKILAREETEFADYIRHTGQEFCMVLSGVLRICFETGERVTLKRTESLYFDSGIGHKYLSVGKADAEVVVVMSEGN